MLHCITLTVALKRFTCYCFRVSEFGLKQSALKYLTFKVKVVFRYFGEQKSKFLFLFIRFSFTFTEARSVTMNIFSKKNIFFLNHF